MLRWERRLSRQDESRHPHAFDWGLDVLGLAPGPDPRRTLLAYARDVLHGRTDFFADPGPPPVADEPVPGRFRFPSAVRAPEDEAGTVSVRLFEPRTATDRAMIVVPQ